MSRAVDEWIGKTDDSAIPTRVKARIVMAQDGICACGCGVKLGSAGERIEFDHEIALILGGENRESNIRALRCRCHKGKTRQDGAQKSVEARKRAKFLGLDKPKRIMPGSRASKWKKRLDGTVVLR